MEMTEKSKSYMGQMNTVFGEIDQQAYGINLDYETKKKSVLTGTFPKFHENGYSENDIKRMLEKRLVKDKTYHSGKILGAMTTEPHPFAREIYYKYIEKNLGDSGLVPETRKIEEETIHMLGELLGDPNVHGNFVSGGTEANIIAMYLARMTRKEIKKPEVVLPIAAHYSFDKAASLLGLKLRKIPVDKNYVVDLDKMEKAVNENTIAIVGIAGTTALGLVDPLREIGKIASRHNLYYHVDGAFGGLVLPFLRELGHDLPDFDLTIPEIVSYTVDPHKMGMGVNPSGAFLVRNKMLMEYGFEIPYLAGGGFKSFNITGTRPGAPVLAFWALIHKLGRKGFRKIVERSMENTYYLMNEIEEIETLRIACKPQTPVLGIQIKEEVKIKRGIDIKWLNSKLREKGWALGLFEQWKLIRAVMMPHVKREHIEDFVSTLHEIL